MEINEFKFYFRQEEAIKQGTEKKNFYYATDRLNKQNLCVKAYGEPMEIDDFIAKYTKSNNYSFYELITKGSPRMEYYDIDNETEKSSQDIFNEFAKIYDNFLILHKIKTKPDWAITDSSKKGKVSLHIINRNRGFLNEIIMKDWYNELNYFCESHYPDNKNVFDTSVCSSNRCMRMIKSTKLGQNRPLESAKWYHQKELPLKEYLIQNICEDYNILNEVPNKQLKPVKKIEKEVIKIESHVGDIVRKNNANENEDVEILCKLIIECIQNKKHTLCDSEEKDKMKYEDFRNFMFAVVNASMQNNLDYKELINKYDLYTLYRHHQAYNKENILKSLYDNCESKTEQIEHKYSLKSLHYWGKENDKYTQYFDNMRIVVKNDKEACDKLLEKMEGYIYSCKNIIYVKTKLTKIWTNNETEVDREIANTVMNMDIIMETSSGNVKPYSKDITGVRTLLSLIKYTSPINDNLIETIRLSSKGKIFFSDGVYDFSIGKFRQETQEDMTPIRINRKYNSTVDNTTREEIMKIINSIFNDEKQTINMLQHGARGLAGCIEDKDFIIGTGLRDCGKGILTKLFTQAFGVYATEVNANNFIGSKRIGISDEAKNRMWLLPHIWSRLLFANECDIDNGNDKAIINGVLIKSLMSGGDVQKARALHKSEIDFIFNGRLIMFMNDLPEIKPVDTCQHMTLFEFPNKFIMPEEYKEKKQNKDLQPYEKKAIINLKEKLNDDKYINAFIQLVFENYQNKPVNNTDDVKNASKEFRIDAGDELLFYKECFDYSDPKIFTTSAEIYEAVNKKYPEMSSIKIKSFLTKNMKLAYKQKQINGERARGFFGIKIKNKNNDNLDYFKDE